MQLVDDDQSHHLHKLGAADEQGLQLLEHDDRDLEVASEDLVVELERDANYLVNPGSVGQPRDSDPRAAYALYDSQTRLITFVRTAYDIRTAQKKIIDAGLPDVLALRLESGV